MTTDSTDSAKQSDSLREMISNSLEKAQLQRNILKRKNDRYATASVILSVLATLLAGSAGIFGNDRNWRAACVFAAVCSAGVTVTTKLQTAEQLTEASECVGQLKALRIETVLPMYDLEQVSEKYQQILTEFSTIDC